MRIKEGYFDRPAAYPIKARALAAKGELYKAAEAPEVNCETFDTPLKSAVANAKLLQSVCETPKIKAYFDQGGRVEIAREGLWVPKYRVSYTRQGLVIDSPLALRKLGKAYGQEEVFTPSMMEREFAVGENKAVRRFAKMSPRKLLKRMASRIDPNTLE